MNRLQRRAIGLAAVAGIVVLAAAGSPSMAASKKPAEDIKGQTINVLVPYRIPPAVISSFTKATGVKVNYVVTGWDATHTKLVVANTARTYIADVAEFDWSFTGQFAGAKWVEPLESYLPKPLLADLASTGAAFKSGGKTYAACFSNDFRISIYNKKMFAKAGIKTFPRTLDRARPGGGQAQGRRRPVPALHPDGGDRGRRHAVVPAHARQRRATSSTTTSSRRSRSPARPATRPCSGRRWPSRRAGSRPAPSRSTTRPPSTSSPPARPRSCSRPAPATS